jgi:hypothetical protein
MIKEKEAFLKNELIPLLGKSKADDKGLWGVMNVQQMVEHFTEAVRIASGKLEQPLYYHGERLEKNRTFLMTETPFRQNTVNPLLPKEGIPHVHQDLSSAIAALQKELDHFFEIFDKNPGLQTANPIFGELDYLMNIQLLHKHALHHLTQFGLLP